MRFSMQRALSFAIVTLCVACTPAPTAPTAPPAPVLASLDPAVLDAFIAQTVKAQHAIGVNVGVLQNGKVILAKGYGLANTSANTPVAPETLFAVGSITKQFTCAVALQMEQEGKLSFNDTVAKYEPSLTRASDITVRDLGNHVSGAMSYSTLAIQQKGKMRMLAVATEKRLPQFPDVPTLKELGLNWVDGAYRGIGVPKSTPPDVRKAVSDMMDAVNKDPELRKRMTEGGFEVTDIGLEQIPAFVKERSVDYLNAAKGLGMVK